MTFTQCECIIRECEDVVLSIWSYSKRKNFIRSLFFTPLSCSRSFGRQGYFQSRNPKQLVDSNDKMLRNINDAFVKRTEIVWELTIVVLYRRYRIFKANRCSVLLIVFDQMLSHSLHYMMQNRIFLTSNHNRILFVKF